MVGLVLRHAINLRDFYSLGDHTGPVLAEGWFWEGVREFSAVFAGDRAANMQIEAGVFPGCHIGVPFRRD